MTAALTDRLIRSRPIGRHPAGMTAPELQTPAPSYKPPRWFKWLMGACAVAGVLGIAYGLLWGPEGDGGKPDTGRERGAAIAACRYFVEDRLVAPSTVDYNGQLAARLSGGEWTVTGEVDAENRFGVPIRMDFRCVVRHDGGDWVLVSMTGLDG